MGIIKCKEHPLELDTYTHTHMKGGRDYAELRFLGCEMNQYQIPKHSRGNWRSSGGPISAIPTAAS